MFCKIASAVACAGTSRFASHIQKVGLELPFTLRRNELGARHGPVCLSSLAQLLRRLLGELYAVGLGGCLDARCRVDRV